MKKRLIVLTAIAMIAGSLMNGSSATAAPTIPDEPNIVDPTGDANTTSGNTVGPADASTVGDLMAVWFTNDADTISVHIQTERPAPASSGTIYEVYTDQTDGFTGYMNGCLRFGMLIPAGGTTNGPYQGAPLIKLVDRCNDGTSLYSNGVEGEYVIDTMEDGTGVLTATFPRSYSPLLAPGEVLTQPQARSSVPVGSDAETPTGRVGFVSFRIDDTQIGTDYAIATGGTPKPEPEPEPVPDPGADEPKKNDCSKKKTKKARKKCEKKNKGPKDEPKTAKCDAYVPGEQGAEAETSVVTDENTEEAPIEIEYEFGAAGGSNGVDTTVHIPHNVQVDSKAAEAGLYVKLSTPVGEDPDLFAYWPNGTEAARAAGFNPLLAAGPVPLFDGTGNGGHSGFTYEQLDGIRTADCGGYTLDLVNWLGAGGTYTLTLWLGEIVNDPQPPAE